MELLQLTDFEIDTRRLNWYFDKYQFKINVFLPGVHFFRYTCNAKDFQNRLEMTVWDGTESKYGSMHPTVESKVMLTRDKIRSFITWRQWAKENQRLITTRIQYDNVDVYSNDLEALSLLKQKLSVAGTQTWTCYRVEKYLNYERDTIYHKNPKHKLRLFMTSRRWTLEERQDLKQFIDSNECNLHPCKTLRDWTIRMYRVSPTGIRWSQSSFFIDIDDEVFVTYLSLKFPNFLRKISKIEKR